jgi:hypothetical protein
VPCYRNALSVCVLILCVCAGLRAFLCRSERDLVNARCTYVNCTGASIVQVPPLCVQGMEGMAGMEGGGCRAAHTAKAPHTANPLAYTIAY